MRNNHIINVVSRQFNRYLRNKQFDYATRISYWSAVDGVCKEETDDFEQFADDIDNIIVKYDIGGKKEGLGTRNGQTIIVALKKFKEFLENGGHEYCKPKESLDTSFKPDNKNIKEISIDWATDGVDNSTISTNPLPLTTHISQFNSDIFATNIASQDTIIDYGQPINPFIEQVSNKSIESSINVDSTMDYTSQLSETKRNIDYTTQPSETKRADYLLLKKEYEQLTSHFNTLKNDYDKINSDHSGLKNEYDDISNDYDNLNQENNQLKVDHKTLKTDYETLLSNMDSTDWLIQQLSKKGYAVTIYKEKQ